jgi:hypothetical protein
MLQIGAENGYKNYKESGHMKCLANLISQHIVEISPIWIPLSARGL